jgi:hypothetical protein
MSLRVNTDCDDDSQDNHCFYNVDPQGSLRESQNSIRFHHDFTH